MAEVVKANATLLRDAGFNKRRHCFNRVTPAGLVHVVNFWQHPKEPPAWTEIPGIRERGYGTFRLDFGVYVPEMIRMHGAHDTWVNEPTCDLRTTIGDLIFGNGQGDWWWPLSDANAEQVATSALLEHGLPWLGRFRHQDDVLNGFRANGPFGIGMSPAGALDIAQMLTGLGRHDEARATLERYLEQPVHQNHATYLAAYLPSIGHPDLVPRVTAKDREY